MSIVSTPLVSLGDNRRSLRSRQELVPSAVLGIWLFLFTEIMMFCGLISAYLVLRHHAGTWPPPGQPRLPVSLTAVNTLILLASGFTVWRVRPLLVLRRPWQAHRWARATLLLGSTFLAVQGYEWLKLIGYGLTARANIYGGLFYTIIGTHAVHVLGALLALVVVTRQVLRGVHTAANRNGLVAVSIYWTFVVVVWPILYLLVYLL